MAKILTESAFVLAVALVTYRYFCNTVDRESMRGKRVLVTGASQNIGEELAYQYAKLGAKLVITARRENVLQKVAEKCTSLGAQKASYLVADMSDTASYEALIEDAVKILGGLDVLVLNHVVAKHGRWNGSEAELEFLELSIPVNYYSYVRLYSSAVSHLKKSEGRVIVVGSQAGRPGIPNTAVYGASKSAVLNFFTSVQMEKMRHTDLHPSITIGILGAIDTQQARWYLSKEKMNIRGYPVSDTVSVMIDGSINRERYVYAPAYIRFLSLGRELCPEVFDRILLYVLFGYRG